MGSNIFWFHRLYIISSDLAHAKTRLVRLYVKQKLRRNLFTALPQKNKIAPAFDEFTKTQVYCYNRKIRFFFLKFFSFKIEIVSEKREKCCFFIIGKKSLVLVFKYLFLQNCASVNSNCKWIFRSSPALSFRTSFRLFKS